MTCHRGKFQGMTARDRPDGVVAHVGVAAVGGVAARPERLLRGLRVVPRDPRALPRFGHSLRERLSHLERHEGGQLVRLRLEKIGQAFVHRASLGERGPAPEAERGVGAVQGGVHLAVGRRRELGHHLLGGRIQGPVEHQRLPPGGWRRLYFAPTSSRSSIEIASRVFPFLPTTVVALSIEL